MMRQAEEEDECRQRGTADGTKRISQIQNST